MKKRFKVVASAHKYDAKHKVLASKKVVASNVMDDPLKDNINEYLPRQGEGNTMASQIATAVAKIIYKWYNDGDVYDNVSSPMEGWANDISSFANWLYKYVPGMKVVLEDIFDCYSDDEYEDILYNILQTTGDREDLENWDKQPKQGSVYNCDGPFAWRDPYEEEEEDDYYEEEDEEEYY